MTQKIDLVGHFNTTTDSQGLLLKYESIIDDLTCELDYLRNEHSLLKSKISSLIIENDLASKRYNDVLSDKCKISNENEIIENLKQQIKYLTEEKERFEKLWQNSVKTIDSLETDIRIYENGTEEFIPKNEIAKLKNFYEEKIKSLLNKLSQTEIKFEILSKNNSNTLVANYSDVNKSLEVQENSIKIVKQLEEEIINLQNRLRETNEIRTDLEQRHKEKDKMIHMITKRNEEYIYKVKESIQIIEAALMEKDGALLREKESNDKIDELSKLLSDVIKDVEEKILKEKNAIQNEYREKNENLLKDLIIVQNEIKIKTVEIEKYSSKCSLLENELALLRKGHLQLDDSSTSKLLILEKNLESTFQKLIFSEKQNIHLVSERDSIKSDMEEMARHFERDIKTREIEKISLQSKIKQLQSELDKSNSTLCQVTSQLNNLNEKFETMEKDFNDTIENKEKLLQTTHLTKINKLNQSHNEKLKILHSQLELQQEINAKWRTETKSITENLEKLIHDLRKEIHKLKKENKLLLSQSVIAEQRTQEYKIFLNLLSKDVSKITELTLKSNIT